MFEALLEKGRQPDEYLEIFPEYNPDVDDEEIPKTISKHLLDLECLKKQYQYSKDYVENVESLKKKYIGWKKSRGDGNCYYRSVISSYFLKILHYNCPSDQLQNFIQKLENILTREEFENYYYDVNQILGYLRKALASVDMNKVQFFIDANQKLQDSKFDLLLVRVSRIIAYIGLEIMINDPELSNFFYADQINDKKELILEMGREAEADELMALPIGLGIIVTQINILGRKVLENQFYSKDRVDGKIQVSIISKSKGHYDGLYSKQEMEIEMQNPFNRKYGLHHK